MYACCDHAPFASVKTYALPDPFGKKVWELRPDLKGRKWVRVEAWDVAANGTFSEPVWLEGAGSE